jgi:hypothetical protein
MKTGKIYPNVIMPNDLSRTITDGYYDTDTNSSSSDSTPRIYSQTSSPPPKSTRQTRVSSPISNISSKRRELLRAQSMMQHRIRGSINNISRKIKEKKVKHKHDVDELEQRRVRLIKEFNDGVLDQDDRIRGTTPPDEVNAKNITQQSLRNESISLTHMTIDHAKKIIELEKELEKQHAIAKHKEEISSFCAIL